jgi:hypothetical protein
MFDEPTLGESEVKLMTICAYDSQIEAEFAKARLESAGIICILRGDGCGGMRPSLSFVNGICVIVRADEADRELEILNDQT